MDWISFKLCLVLIILAPREVSAEVLVVTGQEKERINLYDFLNCQPWTTGGGKAVDMPMNVTKWSTGVYLCEPGGHVILFVAYVNAILGSLPEPAFHTEQLNMTMVCFAEFWPEALKISSSLATFDDNSNQIAGTEKAEASVEKKGLSLIRCIGSFVTDKVGDFPYHCNWNLAVDYEGQTYKDTMIINKTVVIYLPVRNVKPDKTTVATYEAVFCTAEGHPPPHYFSWVCNGLSWYSSSEVLNLMRAKKYLCTCTVENNVPSEDFRSLWKGEIEAVAHEGQEDDIDDEYKDEDDDNTVTRRGKDEDDYEDEKPTPRPGKNDGGGSKGDEGGSKSDEGGARGGAKKDGGKSAGKSDKGGARVTKKKEFDKKKPVESWAASDHDVIIFTISASIFVAMVAENWNDFIHPAWT